MTTDRVPHAGLLSAALLGFLILDFFAALAAVAVGAWVYLASLVLVGAVSFGALKVLREHR